MLANQSIIPNADDGFASKLAPTGEPELDLVDGFASKLAPTGEPELDLVDGFASKAALAHPCASRHKHILCKLVPTGGGDLTLWNRELLTGMLASDPPMA